jgi:hypothetical protein
MAAAHSMVKLMAKPAFAAVIPGVETTSAAASIVRRALITVNRKLNQRMIRKRLVLSGQSFPASVFFDSQTH